MLDGDKSPAESADMSAHGKVCSGGGASMAELWPAEELRGPDRQLQEPG